MTNTTAVIVALPSALDSIRLVGDEEKHATILFLGETSSLPPEAKSTMLETLATASTMFRPFYESTMSVERLGSDVPPALVAKLSNRCLGQIRDALQINPALSVYMGNGTQHPQYTPHVTLGYPDWAGEDKLKQLCKSLYEVNFDRLGLWWNDERFEFNLGMTERGELKMKMSVEDFLTHQGIDPSVLKADTSEPTLVERFLAHVGVKGMKWGIRKDRGEGSGGGKSGETKGTKSETAPVARSAGGGAGSAKKDDDLELSADAERFIKTRMKAGHEMSDVELRTALNRAQMTKQYDEMFGDKPSSALQAKVNEMQLQKQYAQLSAELNPPKKTAVKKLVDGASSAYTAYSTLDKAVGGALSGQVGKKLDSVLDPEGSALKNRRETSKIMMDARKQWGQSEKAVAEAQLARVKLAREQGAFAAPVKQGKKKKG